MSRDSLDGNNDSVLSEVFAFIETFNSSDSESTSSVAYETSSGDSNTIPSPVLLESALSSFAPVTSSQRKKKAKRLGTIPQSTKFQRLQRSQVLALRQQVLELTARLEQLQRTRRDATNTAEIVHGPKKPKEFLSVWEDLAIVQCQERQRSEQTNRELKVILARQRKLEQSVCKLLGRKDTLEGMELLCRLQPIAESTGISRSPQLNIDISDAVIAELEMTAATLYLRTNSLFPPLQTQPPVSFFSQDKFSDPLGTYIETTTTTPMSCSLHLAAEIVWKGTTKESQDQEKVPRFMRAKCFNSLARSCKLDLYNTVRIDGLNFVRRYIDRDRVVLVSAATWFLPAEGIHFQDNVWTIVTRSPTDPHNASVVQSFCQFGAQSSAPMSEEAFAPAQEYVRGSVGTKLRHLQEMQQKFLLEHDGSQIHVY
ncbi:hypothetical protein PPTG_04468 [Phytophthora nicotianae INRA-310]|uniref:M96 mating-specific protein family n=1 Tax=Phytophthora nicotianae (strain INRA-310) TaxID=761204 RepID=W2R1A6_PHYN3|nr:hypothetical protein PPTG_04468 [Phytophthora nicotianae INRA-310]ETN19051.1 hypothetical protein PPTG_04468 [Phytophthora nicotianae INRA-310]